MILEDNQFIVNKTNIGFEIDCPDSKKHFFLRDDSYYLELAQLVEILKVEGYWNSKGNMSITSKDFELIEFYQSLFIELCISTRLSISLKFKLEANLQQKIVLYENWKERSFYLGRNGFTGEKDTIVFNTTAAKKEFLIRLEDKEISFTLNKQEHGFSTSENGVRLYYVLRASNIAFTTFLDKTLEEKSHSHEIRASKLLTHSPPELITKVFGALIDCEGSLRFKGLTRSLYVRMCNPTYLNDWKSILRQIGINSNLRSCDKNLFELTITCNQNFKKLNAFGFELHHHKKRTRFKDILKGYKKHQVERGTALEYYERLVKNNPKCSALQISKIANKSKRVVSHYLIKLVALNRINCENTTKQKYIYY